MYLGGLVHGLVGEGAGPGDDADAPLLVDVAGHDADLALKNQAKISFCSLKIGKRDHA